MVKEKKQVREGLPTRSRYGWTLLYGTAAILVSLILFWNIYTAAGLAAGLAAGSGCFAFLLLLLIIRRVMINLEKKQKSIKDQDSFRTLMTTTPDYVALVDELNCVTYISKPLATFAHIEVIDMVIGRPILDLFRSMDMKLMFSAIIKSQGFYENTWKLNLSGEDRYFKIIADRLLGSTGGLLINMSDITPVMDAKNESERAALALQVERDEIAAMKDNLNEGIFLIDRNYAIQPQYSRTLEEILAGTELQGKNFVDLLVSSFKAKDLPILKNYFNMILNQSYDKAMLDDINPLQELPYVSVQTGVEKTLRCSFSRVDRGGGEVFILGSIQDITLEKQLQRQIAEEEVKRQGEMRSLFEIIQVDPVMFNDYLEDIDYEFDRINAILKDGTLSSREILVEIYQAVHAMKSNSVILGLNNIGNKYHELEEVIKEIRDRDDILFNDILRVTVELEKVMQEKDRFQEVLDKIQSFRSGSGQKQGDDILVETLSRAVSRAAEDLHKKVRFIPEGIDPAVMTKGPRRLMKEILLQLVRNGVYHGIEDPEERRAAGKSETGAIRLSIKIEKDRIHISLRDDGRGLNFDQIEKKAEDLNLIPRGTQDKNLLIKVLFAPGFSTAGQADMHAGRGIGLNLVKERVQEKKGSIKLQTEPGKGTVFNIYIPLDIPEEENQAS
jgi:two-component system chemotaxis sensor kinase CheA